MGRLNKAIDQIRAQMARLGPSQRLLIGSLVVIMLMTLFVVQQYTGKPAMVHGLSGRRGDDHRPQSLRCLPRDPRSLAAGSRPCPGG